MQIVFNKLVRDKIPEKIKNNGEIPYTRILNDEEYKTELIKKLEEEYLEVKEAPNKQSLLEECADMMEVIFSIANLEGASQEELLNIMKEKKEKRGGFDKRIFLEKTE